jgi:RNA-directed DNA polymerase
MMKCLEVRIKDPSLLLLIRRFLRAGYIDAGQLVLTAKGTPQGGNLSPILANIFLHYVLDLWFEKKIKPKVRGACQLVRYADDFICMVQYAVVRFVSFTEEPDAGNPQVRFCEGR